MEMNPGALPRPGTGILVPRNLVAMAAEIGIASGEKGSGIRVFATGDKYMRRGGHQKRRGGPRRPPRRPGVGPRQVAAWATPGSPLAPLWLFAKLPIR